jgi:hypothetical protein
MPQVRITRTGTEGLAIDADVASGHEEVVMLRL